MQPVIVNDRVYGNYTIDNSLLIELVSSRPVQRLKYIASAGITPYILPNRDVSRYEHSVGVMKLLIDLDASLEEQAAGLLHDVPHTVFSHVIDVVFRRSEVQDFHERFHRKIIMESEIPRIIERYGLEPERIMDERNFPLLERKLPDLCADRLDYSMRDMYVASRCDNNAILELRKHMIVHNNEIMFDDGSVAFKYAVFFLDAARNMWSDPVEMAGYEIFAEAIRIGLEKGIVTEGDLFTTDEQFYAKLSNSRDPAISSILQKISPRLRVRDNPHDFDFHCTTKLRYVDPKFIDEEGDIKRVSSAYPEFSEMVDKHKERAKRGVYIKVVSY